MDYKFKTRLTKRMDDFICSYSGIKKIYQSAMVEGETQLMDEIFSAKVRYSSSLILNPDKDPAKEFLLSINTDELKRCSNQNGARCYLDHRKFKKRGFIDENYNKLA